MISRSWGLVALPTQPYYQASGESENLFSRQGEERKGKWGNRKGKGKETSCLIFHRCQQEHYKMIVLETLGRFQNSLFPKFCCRTVCFHIQELGAIADNTKAATKKLPLGTRNSCQYPSPTQVLSGVFFLPISLKYESWVVISPNSTAREV